MIFIIHNFMFFTGAYSNNAFPEPLSKEEEDKEKIENADINKKEEQDLER